MGESKKDWKTTFFSGICYPENMIDNWEDEIEHLLQVPLVYCIHDSDVDLKESQRKVHVHVMFKYPASTTHKHAGTIFNLLSKPDRKCCPVWESVIDVRYMYDYFIHASKDAIRKKKFRYDESKRIECNGWDIGLFEQISLSQKYDMMVEIEESIEKEGLYNYFDLMKFCRKNLSQKHAELVIAHSGHFERMVKGYYLQFMKSQAEKDTRNIIITDAKDKITQDVIEVLKKMQIL